GGFLLHVAAHPSLTNKEPPPAFLGWIFIVLGAVFFLVGVTMAICILIAGRCLSRRKGYSFALVIACIECLFVPFGTILGVFTIVALSRESVKALFSGTRMPAPLERRSKGRDFCERPLSAMFFPPAAHRAFGGARATRPAGPLPR